MHKTSRRILGIDPGYGRLGYGVLDVAGAKSTFVACGVITTPANTPSMDRLQEIAKDVRAIIAKYQPSEMVIEELFFGQSSTTALKVAEVRGVLLLLAAEHQLIVREVKPVEVKMALTGYGRAKKQDMQAMIARVLGLSSPPKPDDAADALAIAWVGAGKWEGKEGNWGNEGREDEDFLHLID